MGIYIYRSPSCIYICIRVKVLFIILGVTFFINPIIYSLSPGIFKIFGRAVSFAIFPPHMRVKGVKGRKQIGRSKVSKNPEVK